MSCDSFPDIGKVDVAESRNDTSRRVGGVKAVSSCATRDLLELRERQFDVSLAIELGGRFKNDTFDFADEVKRHSK